MRHINSFTHEPLWVVTHTAWWTIYQITLKLVTRNTVHFVFLRRYADNNYVIEYHVGEIMIM